MSQLSETARELVLTHELSHAHRNPLLKGILYGSVVFFIGGVHFLYQATIGLVYGASLSNVIIHITIEICFIALLIIAARLEETIADYCGLPRVRILRTLPVGVCRSGWLPRRIRRLSLLDDAPASGRDPRPLAERARSGLLMGDGGRAPAHQPARRGRVSGLPPPPAIRLMPPP